MGKQNVGRPCRLPDVGNAEDTGFEPAKGREDVCLGDGARSRRAADGWGHARDLVHDGFASHRLGVFFSDRWSS